MHFSLPYIAASDPEHPHTISLKLRDLNQLFNSMDPSPFVEKDRAKITDLEFKRLLRQGRTSLFIGLLFLAACLVLSRMLLGREMSAWAAIVRESLTIAGWVAMWRPMQIYLYDWWPLLRRSRIYAKLSHMPVELVHKSKS
jgi:hypothetical protein